MFTTYRIVGLAFVLLLGACASGRDAVMQLADEKYTGKVVSITEFDTAHKMGYTIEPEGLKLLSDLGVVCKDDEAVLQETYEKSGSFVYCENDPKAKNHVMLLKIAMAPSDNNFSVIAKHFNTWTLQAKPSEGDGNLMCVSRAKQDRPTSVTWKNSFADCTYTCTGKTYYIASSSFGAKEFRDSSQTLVLGDIQGSSHESAAATKQLAEKIIGSFVPTRKSAKRLKE